MPLKILSIPSSWSSPLSPSCQHGVEGREIGAKVRVARGLGRRVRLPEVGEPLHRETGVAHTTDQVAQRVYVVPQQWAICLARTAEHARDPAGERMVEAVGAAVPGIGSAHLYLRRVPVLRPVETPGAQYRCDRFVAAADVGDVAGGNGLVDEVVAPSAEH